MGGRLFVQCMAGGLVPRNPPEQGSRSTRGVNRRRPRFGLGSLHAPGLPRLCPIAAAPALVGRTPPHPKSGGNSFSISKLRPTPVSGTEPTKIVAGRMNLSAGCCD